MANAASHAERMVNNYTETIAGVKADIEERKTRVYISASDKANGDAAIKGLEHTVEQLEEALEKAQEVATKPADDGTQAA